MIRWTLRQCMADRKVRVTDLATTIGINRQGLSKLMQHDYLPRIGAQRVEQIRGAIESLSCDRYGKCKTSEIVKLED